VTRASSQTGPSLRQWTALAAALLFLNLSLSFHNVWPTLWITIRHDLSVEIAAVILALIGWRALVGPPKAGVMNALAALLTVMCIGRYAEVTAPALYGRSVNIYWDVPHLPRIAAMLAESASPWLVGAVALGLVALLIAIFAGLRWSLGRVSGSLAVRGTRRALGALSAGLVVFYMTGYTGLPLNAWQWFSLPVSTTYWRQAAFMLEALNNSGSENGLPTVDFIADSDLGRVSGADVFFVFVESYGATAFDDASVSEMLGPSRADLAAALNSTERRAVSAFVESPTFGGASWLAHASLFTGLEVRDNGAYDLLLTQDRETVTGRFAASGYRVVALMPGLRAAWPEGAFYGFDAVYGARALQYLGPEFGWWRIPDQYALARLDQAELSRADRPPLFLFFPTISTHLPFRPTPPYQPDWSRVLTAQPFDADRVRQSLARTPEWTNLSPAYADTLAYTFRYLSGYLRRRASADVVLVLLGDHQPPSSVSGLEARWDVPVHVIAGRGEILDALLDAGFTEGLTPENAPIGPMHELTRLLLDAFAAR